MNAQKVIIQLSSEEKSTFIAITDFVIGMPKSEFKNIFTTFTHRKNVDLSQDAGLDLSIVKPAVDVLRLEITVNSTIKN